MGTETPGDDRVEHLEARVAYLESMLKLLHPEVFEDDDHPEGGRHRRRRFRVIPGGGVGGIALAVAWLRQPRRLAWSLVSAGLTAAVVLGIVMPLASRPPGLRHTVPPTIALPHNVRPRQRTAQPEPPPKPKPSPPAALPVPSHTTVTLTNQQPPPSQVTPSVPSPQPTVSASAPPAPAPAPTPSPSRKCMDVLVLRVCLAA